MSIVFTTWCAKTNLIWHGLTFLDVVDTISSPTHNILYKWYISSLSSGWIRIKPSPVFGIISRFSTRMMATESITIGMGWYRWVPLYNSAALENVKIVYSLYIPELLSMWQLDSISEMPKTIIATKTSLCYCHISITAKPGQPVCLTLSKWLGLIIWIVKLLRKIICN